MRVLRREIEERKREVEREGRDDGNEGSSVSTHPRRGKKIDERLVILEATYRAKDTFSAYIHSCVSKIRNFSKGRMLVKQLGNHMIDTEFLAENADRNPHILVCKNGVLEETDDDVIFRAGNPTDNARKTTKIVYTDWEEMKGKTSAIEVVEFMEKLFPIEDEREWILLLLSTILFGEKKEQLLPIMYGKGSNGKSKLFTLIETTLGEYFETINSNLITRGGIKNPHGPTSEYAKLVGIRAVTIRELDKDQQINIGTIKDMSGGETMTACEKYGRPFKFAPQFLWLIGTNDLPSFDDSTDEGLWRRIIIILFRSKFVDDVNMDRKKPFQFPKDPRVEKQVKSAAWGEAFLSLLVHKYKEVIKMNFAIMAKVPKSFVEMTDRFKFAGDEILRYLHETIVETDELEDTVDINGLYVGLINWMKENSPTARAPSKSMFQQYMDRRYEGKIRTHLLIKHKLKADPMATQEEEEDMVGK